MVEPILQVFGYQARQIIAPLLSYCQYHTCPIIHFRRAKMRAVGLAIVSNFGVGPRIRIRSLLGANVDWSVPVIQHKLARSDGILVA